METSAPLVNGVVNDALFHSSSHTNQMLSKIIHFLRFLAGRLAAELCCRFCVQLLCGHGYSAATNLAL